jgi:hypothetical protein
MKKIVAIMAVSLMLLASCGQIKELVSQELNKSSENIENTESKFPTTVVKKTFWRCFKTTIAPPVGNPVH